MMHSKNSRRSFLGSMAILTAGAAVGSPTSLLSSPDVDLKALWQRFCTLHDGTAAIVLDCREDTISIPDGHRQQNGPLVHFPNERLWARPTWIFWGTSESPNDVVVTLYADSMNKLLRINRFELDALLSLHKNGSSTLSSSIATMKQHDSTSAKGAFLKTTVRGRRISTTVRNLNNAINLPGNTIYHS